MLSLKGNCQEGAGCIDTDFVCICIVVCMYVRWWGIEDFGENNAGIGWRRGNS